MLRGALCGQVAVGIAAIAIGAALRHSADREDLFPKFLKAGQGMAAVYAPYAAIIIVALVVRAIPSVDLRCLTSVLIFGPFTLLRPGVTVAGILVGWTQAPRIEVVILGLLLLGLMLSMEHVLGRIFYDRKDVPS
jgi:hypothetical protein